MLNTSADAVEAAPQRGVGLGPAPQPEGLGPGPEEGREPRGREVHEGVADLEGRGDLRCRFWRASRCKYKLSAIEHLNLKLTTKIP